MEERVRMNERQRERKREGRSAKRAKSERFEWRNIGYNGGIMSVGMGSRHEQIIRVIMRWNSRCKYREWDDGS